MQVFKLRKSAIVCMLVMASSLSTTATGAEQEFKTLELIRTYSSKEEFQKANTKLLRSKTPIVENEEVIRFIDPETGQILKQLKKDTQFEQIQFTNAEIRKLSDSSHPASVTKQCTGYYLPPETPSFLLVFDYEMTFPPTDEASVKEIIRKTTVYNRRGEVVMDLPSDVNMLTPSPTQEYFIAYYEGMPSVGGEFLYFYHADGTMIAKRTFYGSPRITYSSTGQFAAIHDHWGKQFSIFTKQGEVVFEGNYQDYAGKNSTLEDVFVSDDGNYILLSISNKAILLNRSGNKLWEISVLLSPIENVHFQLDENQIFMFRMSPNILYHDNDPRGFMIVTIDTGEALNEMIDIVYYSIFTNILYIKQRQGDYYEYKIK
jgi:hypothetical protein